MSTVEIQREPYSPQLTTPEIPSSVRGRFATGSSWMTSAEVAADLCAGTCAIVLAYVAYHQLAIGKHLHYRPEMVVAAAFAMATLIAVLLDRDGAYRPGNSLLRIKETERILRVSCQAFALMLPATFVAGRVFSRYVLGLAFVLVPIALITMKQIVFRLEAVLYRRGYAVRNAVIYGAGFTGRRVLSALGSSTKIGIRPVVMVDDDPQAVGRQIYQMGYRRDNGVPTVCGPVTAELIQECKADIMVIAIPSISRARFGQIMAAAADAQTEVLFIPGQEVQDLSVDYVDIDGVLLGRFGESHARKFYELSKRVFDVMLSSTAVMLLGPVLLIIAGLVKLESRGPAFFKQTRVGTNGKYFRLYKFRSMKVDAPAYAFSPKDSVDPRITRLGRWLRKTSLDELPQLINVLKGDMSLVGPRPEMPFITARYDERQRQRLRVRPGITGLWQISADRAFLIHENLQYDLYYIKNRGFFIDLAILLHTAAFAMRGV